MFSPRNRPLIAARGASSPGVVSPGVQLPLSTQSEAVEGGRQGISELQRCLALQCQSVVNKVLMLTVQAVSSSWVKIRPQSAKNTLESAVCPTTLNRPSAETVSKFNGEGNEE